jgi:transposase
VFLYLDDDTIRGWYKTFQKVGWGVLTLDGWPGGQSRMTSDQQEALCAWLDERFCRLAVEIRAHIADQFGLHYCHSGCLKLLRQLRFEYRKPKPLPRVADEAAQAKPISSGTTPDTIDAKPSDDGSLALIDVFIWSSYRLTALT